MNYNFEIENETLSVRIENTQSTFKCTISDWNQFMSDLGLSRFERKSGLICDFKFDSGRVKNLKIIGTKTEYEPLLGQHSSKNSYVISNLVYTLKLNTKPTTTIHKTWCAISVI